MSTDRPIEKELSPPQPSCNRGLETRTGQWLWTGLSWPDGSMAWLAERNEGLQSAAAATAINGSEDRPRGHLDPGAETLPFDNFPPKHRCWKLRQVHISPLLHEFRPQARHDLRGKRKRDRAAVGNSGHMDGTYDAWMIDWRLLLDASSRGWIVVRMPSSAHSSLISASIGSSRPPILSSMPYTVSMSPGHLLACDRVVVH